MSEGKETRPSPSVGKVAAIGARIRDERARGGGLRRRLGRRSQNFAGTAQVGRLPREPGVGSVEIGPLRSGWINGKNTHGQPLVRAKAEIRNTGVRGR